MRFFLYDLKRIFSARATVFLLLLSPLAVILLFSAVVAPMLYTAGGLRFKLALCNEDGSEPVRQFISQLVHSQALEELVTLYPVKTVELGTQLVENDDVSVLVHIPGSLFEKMNRGETVEISVISTPAHALEASLITMTLDSALSAVGKSQNLLVAAKELLLSKGAVTVQADGFLDESMSAAVTDYMERRQALGKSGTVSPMGEFLPLEYYIGAVFALFAALSILPLVRLTASDCAGAVLRRGLLSGQGSLRFYITRLLSGAVLLLLVQLTLFPAALLLESGSALFGEGYQTRMGALLLAMLLSSLGYSALAIALGTWLPDENAALWTGFFLVLIMAAAAGAIVPVGALPLWVEKFGRLLPLRFSMRAFSVALFDFRRELFWREMGKMALLAAFLLSVGFLGLRRRGRGA